jgi:two-component system OmpR family sensor kinase
LSLRLRLALFGAAVVALALVLFGLALYGLLARSVNPNQDDTLRTRARQAVASLNAGSSLAPSAPVAPADLRSSTDVFLEVFDANWAVIYSTAQLNGSPPVPSARLRVATPEVFGGFFDTDHGLRYFGLRFNGGYVVTGQSTRVPQSNLSGVIGFLIISGVPALMAALAASWLVAGRALRPLKDVAGAADGIGRTRDFGRRLPERRSRDEVALLSKSFNRMLEQLQDSFDSQRRFVADASHELRTPLTTIQGNAGLLAQGPPIAEEVRRAAAADIAAESDRMARLVDRMLTLARADSGLKLVLIPVDLSSVVAEVCRQARAVNPQMAIVDEAAEATVAGDEDALRQLLWILIDNALRYAQSKILVHLEVEGDWARLMVGDDGRGIAPEDRERIFERFYKADSARTRSDSARGAHGAGLGLSIARWITDQHHGRIIAAGSPDGGAGFFVDLPLLRGS